MCSNENRNQTHSKINRLTLNLPHFRVGAGHDVLNLSYMLDFEGTETARKLILNFLTHFSYDLFFVHEVIFLNEKSSVLNCTSYSVTKQIYVTPCFTRLLQAGD